MKRSHYLLVLLIVFIVAGRNDAYTQDTVRIGDPRFMFSQISDSSYFYQYYGNRILTCEHGVFAFRADSSARTLRGGAYTMEHKTNGKSIVLYGIALSTPFTNYYYNESWSALWDNVRDTIWLKVRRGSEENIIDERVVDSVRISLWSEKKTLLFEGHPTQIGNDPWILFDSIIYEAVPLYCGYFEHPLHIRDTNFFVSLELVSHFATMENSNNVLNVYPSIMVVAGIISTPVTWYKHYYTSPTPCGTVSWCPYTEPRKEWPAIIPIIAPRENPSGIYNANNLDSKIYPNPARRQFSVQSSSTVLRVELYDVMGRMVRAWSSPCRSYDLGGIPSGLYTVKVTTPSTSIIKQLLVSDM